MRKCASASACILIVALTVGCASILGLQKTVHERTCESVETVWDADAQDILIIEHGCTMKQLEKHGIGFAEIASSIGGVIAILLSILL